MKTGLALEAYAKLKEMRELFGSKFKIEIVTHTGCITSVKTEPGQGVGHINELFAYKNTFIGE